LLDAGHKVVAPVRSPNKLSDIQNANLTVVEQDLENDFGFFATAVTFKHLTSLRFLLPIV